MFRKTKAHGSFTRDAKAENKKLGTRRSNTKPKRNTGGLRKLNSHINWDLEGGKTNARKDETKVICCVCKAKFVLPFKPRRPDVYCDECFSKRKKSK